MQASGALAWLPALTLPCTAAASILRVIALQSHERLAAGGRTQQPLQSLSISSKPDLEQDLAVCTALLERRANCCHW